MNTATAGSGARIEWGAVLFAVAFVVALLVNIWFGFKEANGSWVLGVIALGASIATGVSYSSFHRPSATRVMAHFAGGVFFFCLSFLMPLVHFADSEKVWVVGNQTTITHTVIIRAPFVETARSVKKKQDVRKSSVATTKDGKTISGIVFGEFRLTEDEQVLLGAVSQFDDANEGIRTTLEGALEASFARAIATRNLADLPDSLPLAYDTGMNANVARIGVKHNGEVGVSYLRVHFFDK